MIVNTICEYVRAFKSRRSHARRDTCLHRIRRRLRQTRRSRHLATRHVQHSARLGNRNRRYQRRGQNHHDEGRAGIDSNRARQHQGTRTACRLRKPAHRLRAAKLRIRHRIEHHRGTVGASRLDGNSIRHSSRHQNTSRESPQGHGLRRVARQSELSPIRTFGRTAPKGRHRAGARG